MSEQMWEYKEMSVFDIVGMNAAGAEGWRVIPGPVTKYGTVLMERSYRERPGMSS